MNTIKTDFSGLRPVSVVMLVTCSLVAMADVDEVTELSRPESQVSLGAGYVSEDNARFGQYTGLNDKGGYGLVDMDLVHRDDKTGTWTIVNGWNLGLDNRDFRFEQRRQGDWGYFLNYSQTPRFDPYTVTTTLTGIGSTQQTIGGSPTPQEYHLQTERKGWALGFDKDFGSRLGVQVSVRSEDKTGERLWGQGTFGTWRFLTDPLDQRASQLDAVLSYTGERLQLTGGYYGTTFQNRNNALTVVGTTLFTGSNQMALPPDNQSHQFHLAGGYSFTDVTRGTFKLAYGMLTQDEQFPTTPVAGAPGSLDGRIDTTLVQAGLTTRLMPKLSMRVDARYEDRNDKTPVFRYFPSQNTSGATNDGTNETRDITTSSGKIDATYRLPAAINLTGGVEYVQKKRNSPPVRSVAFRESTDETTVRLEMRRPISETITGSLGVLHSERGGSDWLPNTGNQVATTTGDMIAPLHLADRERNTARLTTNWMPLDALSFNVRVDISKDEYTGRDFNAYELGPREGNSRNYALDAGYAFTDGVFASLWAQHNVNTYENAECQSQAVPNANSCTASTTNPVWSANLRNVADTFGLTLRSKVTSKIEVSADAVRSKVLDEMRLTSITPSPSLVDTGQPLNDIHTYVTSLRFSIRYALRQNMGLRFTYMFDRYETDDWTWANWNYSPAEGGTTVRQDPLQKVHFFGVTGYYRWW